jgi:predicted permease
MKMDWIRIVLARCASLFRKQKLDADLDEELRSHIDFSVEENLKRGMSAEAARTTALREFGGMTQTKETYRVQRGIPYFEMLARDIRFGLRQLHKSPGLTWTVILTLALGIGATAAMFSVIDAVVLRPLPYRDVDRIVSVQSFSPSGYEQTASSQAYLDMRRLNTTFEALAGYEDYWGMTLRVGDRTQYLNVAQGTDNFFDVFGVQPLMGRTFLPGEDKAGKNNVTVLSYEVWRQTFNGDRGIVGQVVHLDGVPYVVVGVMPAGFRFPYRKPNMIYIPMHIRPSWIGDYRAHWLLTIGRLKPGVSLHQANADMAHVMQEIGQLQPDSDKGRTATLVPIAAALRGASELSEIWLLFGAVLAVLLIACSNVAGLLLARGIAREREMALRIAVGAARGRLVRQLLVENSILGLLGAGAGIALAAALLTVMKVFLAHAFMRGANIQLNLEVIAATLSAGLLSSIGAGLIPAWRAAKSDPNRALKSGASAGVSQHQHQLRASFVVTQVGLSLILLIFSGLLLRTLQGMMQADIGFNPNHLLLLSINPPAGEYRGRDYVRELLMPLEARVQSIPGVTAAGFNDQGPLFGYGSGTTMQLVGHPPDPPDRERNSETRMVTPGYFSALGLPILRGRNFGPQDTAASQPVALVNEAWVKEFLTEKDDPLAQAFRQPDGHNLAIVGVVANARQNAMEAARPEIDFPASRFTMKQQQDAGSFNINLFVRTTVSPFSLVPALRSALHEIGPTVAFQTPITMDDVLDDALVTNRMESWLFGLFACIAVSLAAVGIYGLLMQETASRARDIGLRMALGSTRSDIARLMFARISTLLGLGLGAGIVVTLFLRRAVASVVVIRMERDGIVIAGLVALLAAIGLLVAIFPIRRATSIDPMRALRTE